MSAPTRLSRRLGTFDATVIGVGSMLGAGVFSAFAPAAAAAGSGLLAGLLVAAVVAFCNATASAQLAAARPEAGGAYVHGRERLGPWWGFVAGWGFVVGKTASCAAMALTVAAYTVPAAWQRPVALAVVVLLVAVNYRGVTRTAGLTRVLLAVVLPVLALVVAAGFSTGPVATTGSPVEVSGVLSSAGLLFFAFAGYARIATLGEEVRDPARTIPRAVVLALAVTVVVYAAVGWAVLHALGAPATAASHAPLSDVVQAAGWPLSPLVVIGATAAATGALLALVAGVGRTVLAMARTGDLPRGLDAVHPRFAVPHRAEVLVGVVVGLLVLTTDLRDAIGFSSFCVLVYYFVANLSALRQPVAERRYPRALQVLGLLGCATLALTLPAGVVVQGLIVLGVGVVFRRLLTRRGRAAG
ncbi:APC family permease [Kineococcus sp. SYSU DK003]|uniref:APC family permease n=1 Tax=Kineococcus sp. SYSU DK003 TaxID=3383124 RepID=UPI003D7D0985